MKQVLFLTTILLTALAVSGCTQPGDFCDVYTSPLGFQKETAAQVVKTDRATAESIAVRNGYWSRRCR